ncbi:MULTISPECIES: tyrosine-type recombinase/integrase [Streptomyces]|uniref:tyrosine-type recombinase/integrase n=1 Tax=Streptomyces TaxID=1883 RepID=UPI0018DF91F5|nr:MULTISPECIES: tyrosine-type recombinase/integrase [Streptomyces]MCZ4100815.1 tyrosine-type recombinase/integrase [Streptomyces sp. H39-C1]
MGDQSLSPSAEHGRGRRWQARYTDPTGRRRSPGFTAYEDARTYLEQVNEAIRSNTWSHLDAGNRNVEYFATQMIDRKRRRNKRVNTVDTYDSHLRNHVLPFIGNRVSRTLRRRDSTAFVDYLLEKPGIDSPHTVIQVFKTWRILIGYMLDEDVPLPSNIVSRIELPDCDPRVTIALTQEQVAALATAMRHVEPRYEILVWLAACAGLRTGEALGLKTSKVNWSANLLQISEQRQRGRAAPLKTKASYATLPVDRFLIERLTDHLARFGHPATRARAAGGQLSAGHCSAPDEGLLTTNRFGRPVQRTDLNRKWHIALQLADLPPGTRFHDLKHFYTTRLGACGQHDPKTVQALSRHGEFSQTWQTYAHPPMAVEGVTVSTFSSAFGPSTPLAPSARSFETYSPCAWP